MELIIKFNQCPLVAEDCLLPGFYEGLLWREQAFKLDEAVAIYDPIQNMTEKFEARFWDRILLYCPVKVTGFAHPISGIPARYS